MLTLMLASLFILTAMGAMQKKYHIVRPTLQVSVVLVIAVDSAFGY